MSTKLRVQLLASIVLFGFHIFVLFCVFRPRVTAEYRAYYIDRTSDDWEPFRYPASPEQGMILSATGLPTFVRSMHGFSFREPWGRWTDAEHAPSRIVFQEALSGRICVDLQARPAGSQLGKSIIVALGDKQKPLSLQEPNFAEYYIDFVEDKPADILEFLFSNPVPRENMVHRLNPDSRRLGLAIVSLRVLRGSCPTAQGKPGQ